MPGGAKIPVESGWNISLMQSLLEGYEDVEVITWLRYGWPVSRPPNWEDPTHTYLNHASAVEFPQVIENYIKKEFARGAICGLFQDIPFERRVRVSPLSTHEKKDSADRRIIMDLSWPPGASVNSGIKKDQFMGFSAKLSFPTIDVIACRVSDLMGQGEVLLFKVDLSGYFRQLPIDPGDYSLLMFSWNRELFFDVVSPYFAQRTSNAIKHIHEQADYFLFNYIDDLIGCELRRKVFDSQQQWLKLLHGLGVREAENKQVDPMPTLNCIGTLVDAEQGMMFVLPECRIALMQELQEWLTRCECSVKDIQQLVGKLQFICAVVRPGRLFISRMLEELRNTRVGERRQISTEFKKDVRWWLKFLPQFDGVGILWMLQVKQPDCVAASDACLKTMGAVSDREYIKCEFPEEWQFSNIAHLELLAIVVMFKVWLHKFIGKSVLVKCDNEAVSQVLNSGRARDKVLIMLMREAVYTAAKEFKFRAIYWPGKCNVLPDLLSRWHEGPRVHSKFYRITKNQEFKEIVVEPGVFHMQHIW